ncbi:MAG: HU family DNA-binding protein [Pseudomonadota bacterium]
MTKIELVNTIAQTPGITKVEAQKIIQAFMSSITKALKKGEDVRLMGFGTFTPVKTPAKMYRDIRSGESKKSKEKKVVKFRGGTALSETIQ